MAKETFSTQLCIIIKNYNYLRLYNEMLFCFNNFQKQSYTISMYVQIFIESVKIYHVHIHIKKTTLILKILLSSIFIFIVCLNEFL